MDEPTVDSRQLFEEDADLQLTEQDDGSVIVNDLEAVDKSEIGQDFFENLAVSVDSFGLNDLASNLLDLIERDAEARKKRDEQYAEGIKRTGLGDEAPGGADFEGASKAVHPVLAEGCVDFAARTTKELFPPNGPVKMKIIGKADEEKLEKARRKRDFLNWTLTTKIAEYRDEEEILLTQLPLGGSQYEKFWFDPALRRICMEFVPIDKVLLPFSATSFYTSQRITHVQEITQVTFEDRERSGLYRKVPITKEASPQETPAKKATDAVEGVEEDAYNSDGLRTVYEVDCRISVKDDPLSKGEDGWYIVHVDKATRAVLGLYRNWEPEKSLLDRIEWWVEKKFIPWRGVYGIGLPHLIGSLSGALTGALRALLDSAHINNAPGALKLKGGRASGQNTEVAITEVREIDAPSGVDDIRKVIMPMPFNPPSPVLFQLLEWITNQAKGVVATAEERISEASNNMPVGTAMALIEQGSQVFSSIHARLHESQRRALKIICRLIVQYPDEHMQDLQRFGLTPQDFMENDDIEPVSDPRIFSEAQRFAQLQETYKVAQSFPQLPWNFHQLAKRSLEALRVDGIETLLPDPPKPVTSDPTTENSAAMSGQMIAAILEQDHQAHITSHLAFILSPIGKLAPVGAGQALGVIMNHIQQHIVLLYQQLTEQMQVMVMNEAMMMGIQPSPDQLMAEAGNRALQQLDQFLSQLEQPLQEAQALVQSKMPPPPPDPAVDATFKAAMAQIEARKETDMARLKLDQGKAMSDEEHRRVEASLKQRLEEIVAENNRMIEMMREANKREIESLKQNVELQKNDADNRQKQQTDLLQNAQDNQTAIIIERMRQQLERAAEPPSQEVKIPDLSTFMESFANLFGEMQRSGEERQRQNMELVQKLLSGGGLDG
jgi:hypothetical protein